MPRDPNQLAATVVAMATGEADSSTISTPVEPEKNPAAVALGKLGGAKGGPARAKALSKKRKVEIARAAAKARWAKNIK